MQLHFRFDDLLDEINALMSIASDLLENADSILGAFASELSAIRGKYTSPTSFTWTIREDRPLRTIVSKGEYEPGRRIGTHHVQGDISCTWRIRPIPPAKKCKPVEFFTLTGLASVKVKFHDCCKETGARQGDPLGSFRMEIGMPDQPDGPLKSVQGVFDFPGCFFHAQILGESESFPFPKGLSVPRLPSIMISPLSAIEFVLGELFQGKWSNDRHTQSEARTLAKIHIQRLKALLSWQQKVVTRNERQSPWLSLKKASPDPRVFVA